MGTTPVLRSVVYSANRPFSRPTGIAHLPGRAWAPARPSGCMNTGADIAGDADARMPCRRQARAGQHPAAARSPWRASRGMVQAPGLLHAAEIPPCEACVLYHQPACEVKRPLLAQSGLSALPPLPETIPQMLGTDADRKPPSPPLWPALYPGGRSYREAIADGTEGVQHPRRGFPNSWDPSRPCDWRSRLERVFASLPTRRRKP